MTGNETGIVYVAVGKKYVDEAERSAESAHRHMPSIPIVLWTDDPSYRRSTLFENVFTIKDPTGTFFDKIEPLSATPFEKTIFLDTDTIVLADISELFRLLDRTQLAFAHGPARSSPSFVIDDVPPSFSEPNTGVLAYRADNDVKELFRAWEREYARQLTMPSPPKHDQPAFRRMLFHSSVSFIVLPSEYNLRTVFPMFIGGNTMPRVLHGRGPSLERAMRGIRKYRGKAFVADYSRSLRLGRLLTRILKR